MILITGAGGKTGRAVVRALADRREPMRALLHRPEHVPALRALGATETLAGDLLDPRVVQAAMQGASAVYHMAPNVSPDELAMGQNVIAAARAAGVERFVFHSVLHPHVEAMPHHWQKARVEELLFASGLPFTILQPTAYMQNLAGAWETIVTAGRYTVPYSTETRLSLVDLEDVAQAAARVLTEPGHLGATIEMVGTPGTTPRQLAAALGAVLGRTVTAEAEPLEVWSERTRVSGMGEYQRNTLAAMFAYYNEHGLAGNPQALGALLGRPPTSVEVFVRRFIEEHRV